MTEIKKKPIFLRPGWYRLGRVGKKIKRKQVWRRPKGGGSKVKKRERGYLIRPTIGWGSDKKIRNKIQGVKFTRVETLAQLEKISKDESILIASLGKKKKEEIKKKAEEKETNIPQTWMV